MLGKAVEKQRDYADKMLLNHKQNSRKVKKSGYFLKIPLNIEVLCATPQILQYSLQVMAKFQILYLLLMSHQLHPYLVALFKFIHHQLVCSSFQVILE
jgi:hypothetical protein